MSETIFVRAAAGGVIPEVDDGLVVDAANDDPRSILNGSAMAAFGKDCELAETTARIQ